MSQNVHCVKRVRIRSYSGPHFSYIFAHSYSVRMRENVDQNNSEYGLLRRGCQAIRLQDFLINYVSRIDYQTSLIFCMLIQIHIN